MDEYRTDRIVALLHELKIAKTDEAIGAAVAFLIDQAEVNPGQMQRVLRNEVTRGHQRSSIIELLNWIARVG